MMTVTLAESMFRPLDWIVLALYFLLLIVSGLWLARKGRTGTEDYFLANRSMPVWAVAISVLATSLSAATFIGAPQISYNGDLTYLSTNIGGIIGIFIVALFFIPVFYRYNVATVYELLGRRFGQPTKLASSWMFMIGRVFASGSRVFIASLPAALIVFGDTDPRHLLVAILAMAVVGVIYTITGGISSVIWADVIQTVVFLGAVAVAIGLLLNKIPVGAGEIWHALINPPDGGGSKLAIFDLGLDSSRPYFGFDPSQDFTILTAATGFALLSIGSYGTDHDMVQRMLTCKSSIKGSLSAITAIFAGMPVVLLFMVIGLLLYIFYGRPDIMGAAFPSYEIEKSREVFLAFILAEMPPGLTGLMIAGLFAAGLSSLNSALNAMSSAFVNDFYKRVWSNREERHYLKVGRIAVALWGVILAGFAGICIYWQRSSGDGLIVFALSVMTFAYAGLIAVFMTAIFTKRGNNISAIAALIVGFVAIFLLQPNIWKIWMGWFSQGLAEQTLAFSWRLTIGTGISFLVCVVGPPKAQVVPAEEANLVRDATVEEQVEP